MKVRFKTDAVDIEVDGKDTKDVFVQLAHSVEVFMHTTCGMCDSHSTMPVVRENGGNQYHEMRCMSCGATLAFGQRRSDGALFPKRKDKDGNWLGNSGWVKFRRAEPANDFD